MSVIVLNPSGRVNNCLLQCFSVILFLELGKLISASELRQLALELCHGKPKPRLVTEDTIQALATFDMLGEDVIHVLASHFNISIKTVFADVGNTSIRGRRTDKIVNEEYPIVLKASHFVIEFCENLQVIFFATKKFNQTMRSKNLALTPILFWRKLNLQKVCFKVFHIKTENPKPLKKMLLVSKNPKPLKKMFLVSKNLKPLKKMFLVSINLKPLKKLFLVSKNPKSIIGFYFLMTLRRMKVMKTSIWKGVQFKKIKQKFNPVGNPTLSKRNVLY